MNEPTIYDINNWLRILKKYPKVALLCEELNIKSGEEAKTFMDNFKLSDKNESAHALQLELKMIIFAEVNMQRILFERTQDAIEVGEFEDTKIHLRFLLSDMENTYIEFLSTCAEQNIDIMSTDYNTLYEIFLGIISLKMQYEEPYTNYFVKKLSESGYVFNNEESKRLDLKNVNN